MENKNKGIKILICLENERQVQKLKWPIRRGDKWEYKK